MSINPFTTCDSNVTIQHIVRIGKLLSVLCDPYKYNDLVGDNTKISFWQDLDAFEDVKRIRKIH